MTAVAVPMPGGFTMPPMGGAPVTGHTQSPAAPQGVPVQGGPDAPMPGSAPLQPAAFNYGTPINMGGQPQGQPQGQTQAQFDAAVQAEVARRQGLQQQQAPQQQAPAFPMPTQPQDQPGWLPQNLNQFDVNTLQDPVLRSMGQMIQVVGKDLDLSRVMGNALAHQDPSLIDIAYLVEKGGAQAGQIAQMAQSLVASVGAVSERTTQEVYASAGGQAQWNAATAVFNQSAPPAYKEVVTQMLNSGDPGKIRAAAQTIVEFGAQGGYMPNPAQGIGNMANAGLGGGAGLSAQEFQTALQELNGKRNSHPNWEQAYQDLFAQRAHGKRLGK